MQKRIGMFLFTVIIPLVAGLLAMTGSVRQADAMPILVPTGLNPGDTYHLVFVTSTTRDATSSDIADYDAFVQSAADAAGIGVSSDIGDIGWMAIGSTWFVPAVFHIGVSGPVYRLDDLMIATGEMDMFDGTLSAPISITENLDALDASVWTGSTKQGWVPAPQAGEGLALGPDIPGLAEANIGLSSAVNANWIAFPITDLESRAHHLYAISEAQVVPLQQPVHEILRETLGR